VRNQPSADRIEEVAFGFKASQVLFAALDFGLFSELANGPLDAEAIRERLRLHPRSIRDFLDALVALRLLERKDGLYSNTPEADFYLNHTKPTYIGNFFTMWAARLYGFYGSLAEALRTGKPQNEIKRGEDLFSALYSNPEKLRLFLRSMTGHSLPAAMAIADRFPWQKYKTFLDVGTAEGCLPVRIALSHLHLTGEGFDLPAVQPFFEQYVGSFGLRDRIRFSPCDFFKDPLPSADVIVMGMILHDWSAEEKLQLLRKAYAALHSGGALIVYEHLIDDGRRKNIAGLLMSLTMLIETQGGSDYTGADCRRWMSEVGFRESYVEQLTGIESMVVGIK